MKAHRYIFVSFKFLQQKDLFKIFYTINGIFCFINCSISDYILLKIECRIIELIFNSQLCENFVIKTLFLKELFLMHSYFLLR